MEFVHSAIHFNVMGCNLYRVCYYFVCLILPRCIEGKVILKKKQEIIKAYNYCQNYFRYLKTMKEEHALSIVTFSGWIFFFLINTFYGGALTMFFSTSPNTPFNTFKEGLQSYPRWRWIIEAGYEFLPYERSKGGDPDFIKIWETFKVRWHFKNIDV